MSLQDIKTVWIKLTGSSFALDPNMTDKKYMSLKPTGYYKAIEVDSAFRGGSMFSSINTDLLREIALFERNNVWNNDTRDTLIFFDKHFPKVLANSVAAIGAVHPDMKIDGSVNHPSLYSVVGLLAYTQDKYKPNNLFSIKALDSANSQSTIDIKGISSGYIILDEDFKVDTTSGFDSRLINNYVISKDSNNNLCFKSFMRSMNLKFDSTKTYVTDTGRGGSSYNCLTTAVPFVSVKANTKFYDNINLLFGLTAGYDLDVSKYATKVNSFSEILPDKGTYTQVFLHTDSMSAPVSKYSQPSGIYNAPTYGITIGGSGKFEITQQTNLKYVNDITYNIVSATSDPKYIKIKIPSNYSRSGKNAYAPFFISLLNSINNGKSFLVGYGDIPRSGVGTGTHIYRIINGELYSKPSSSYDAAGYFKPSEFYTGKVDITGLTALNNQIMKKKGTVNYDELLSPVGWSKKFSIPAEFIPIALFAYNDK